MTDTIDRSPRPDMWRETTLRRASNVAAGMSAAAITWVIVELGFGYDLRTPALSGSPDMDVELTTVLASSGVAGLAAWAALAGIERWSARPRLVWTLLASAVLLVSLGGPLSGEDLQMTGRALLVMLHAVVALVLIPGLAATTRGGR